MNIGAFGSAGFFGTFLRFTAILLGTECKVRRAKMKKQLAAFLTVATIAGAMTGCSWAQNAGTPYSAPEPAYEQAEPVPTTDTSAWSVEPDLNPAQWAADAAPTISYPYSVEDLPFVTAQGSALGVSIRDYLPAMDLALTLDDGDVVFVSRADENIGIVFDPEPGTFAIDTMTLLVYQEGDIQSWHYQSGAYLPWVMDPNSGMLDLGVAAWRSFNKLYTVDTPAGTFTDCIAFASVFEGSGIVSFFPPGIGVTVLTVIMADAGPKVAAIAASVEDAEGWWEAYTDQIKELILDAP